MIQYKASLTDRLGMVITRSIHVSEVGLRNECDKEMTKNEQKEINDHDMTYMDVCACTDRRQMVNE
jgi:hypothetical protein